MGYYGRLKKIRLDKYCPALFFFTQAVFSGLAYSLLLMLTVALDSLVITW